MKLTTRGWIVLVIIPAIASLYGLAWIMDHINWVGDHYCFHSSLVCYGLDK